MPSEAESRIDEPGRLRPVRIGARALVRRGWIVVFATLAVTAVAWTISESREPAYRAQSVVQVPSGAGPEGPGDATNARNLAATYAAVIASDEGVARHVAGATAIPFAQVFDRISVISHKDTSVLSLRFTASTPEKAIVGARAIQEAVTSATPLASGVAPGSLQVVSTPTRAVDVSPSSPGTALPVGLILGFLLGGVLLVAREWTDPRPTVPPP